MPKDPFEKIPAAFVEPLESFLAWLELERGLSKNTLIAYARDLVQCVTFLVNEGVADWASVESTQISAWMTSLSRRGAAFWYLQ